MNEENNSWFPLIDDVMGKIILSDIKFAKNFIVSVTNYTYGDLEEAIVTSGEELLPNIVFDTTFRTDLLVKLKNNDIISIELQKENTESSMIKNEAYADSIVSSQKIVNNDYTTINKLTQIIVTLDNYMVPKKERVLLEEFEKVGKKNHEHKIMEKYHKTIMLDLKGEIDYTLVSEDLKGWIILFKEIDREKAKESIKYNKIFEEIIERMEKAMDFDQFKVTLQDKIDFYIADFENIKRYAMEESREEGLELGRSEGLKQGRNVTLFETACKMYDKGIDVNNIKEITGVDMNNIINKGKKINGCNTICTNCKNPNKLKKKL